MYYRVIKWNSGSGHELKTVSTLKEAASIGRMAVGGDLHKNLPKRLSYDHRGKLQAYTYDPRVYVEIIAHTVKWGSDNFDERKHIKATWYVYEIESKSKNNKRRRTPKP